MGGGLPAGRAPACLTPPPPSAPCAGSGRPTSVLRRVQLRRRRPPHHPIRRMTSTSRRFPWHTWLGLAILFAAEAGIAAGSRVIAPWLTPIVWSGYILLVDGLVRRAAGAPRPPTREGRGAPP